jgi:hypothetical protein
VRPIARLRLIFQEFHLGHRASSRHRSALFASAVRNRGCNSLLPSLAEAKSRWPEKEINKANDELGKANDEMSKTQDELNKGNPDKAIDHYRHAWEHAQKATEYASKA